MKQKLPLPVKIGQVVAENVLEDLRDKKLPWSGTAREWKSAPNIAAWRAVMAYRLRSARKRKPSDELLCAKTAYEHCIKLLYTVPGLGLAGAKFDTFRTDWG